MSASKNYWLDRATEMIRFAPDRKAVRQELEGHLQDREERYLAQGMTTSEAAKAAVADMGDPEEVAAELGRIHSPWWGWLWKASRWILIIAAVWAVFLAVAELEPWGRLRTTFPNYTPQTNDISISASGREHTILTVWEPDVRLKLGHYRVTVPHAYLEYSEPFTFDDGYEAEANHTLHIWIKATTWRFWEPMAAGQFMILNRYAADSAGTMYGWDPQRDPEEILSLFCHSYINPLSVWWDVELEMPDGQVPDWVDIPLGYDNDTIRVNLTKEAISS